MYIDLYKVQSPFKCSLCEYCTVPKNTKMSKSKLNNCKKKLDYKIKTFEN